MPGLDLARRRGISLLEVWATTVLLSAGCARAPISVTPAPSRAEASATAIASSTEAALPTQPEPSPTPCFTQEDLAAMPLRDVAAFAQVCYRSSDGMETQIDQAKALDAIHGFLQEEGRLAGFREITRMANSPDGLLRVARYGARAPWRSRGLASSPGVPSPTTTSSGISTPSIRSSTWGRPIRPPTGPSSS